MQSQVNSVIPAGVAVYWLALCFRRSAMRVIFFTTGGPHAGQHVEIAAGQSIRVGRTARSDYALPGDTYLSGIHFEIACDEKECRVRDLGSSNGTFVNGTQITQSTVRDGDRIAAGETTFVVQVTAGDDAEPPLISPQQERTARMYAAGFTPKSPSGLAEVTQKRAHEILMGQTAPLFAAIDASRDASVLGLLGASPVPYEALSETDPIDPAAHAPYLVEMGQMRSPEERNAARAFLENLLKLGWGKGWGIFFTSLASSDELREHLRQFLPPAQGRPTLHLRLYDPRVLRVFAPVCEREDVNLLFGPILAFLIESANAESMLVYSQGSDGLVTAELPLIEQTSQAHAAT